MELLDLDIMVAASIDNIMMVEGEMKEVSEADMLEAMKFAHEAIKLQCQAQIELAEMVEKSKVKRVYCHEENDEELKAKIWKDSYDKVYAIAKKGTAKQERKDAFDLIKEEIIEAIPEEEREAKKQW